MRLDKIVKKKLRIRNKLKKSNANNRLRLTVNRSSKNISAQIIDDINNKTLVSASSFKEKTQGKKKVDMSAQVASELAKKALEKKIDRVYFDRGRYKFHGRIKAFAESLRKNGLNF